MMCSDEQSIRVCMSIHPGGNLLSHAPMSFRVLVLNDPATRSRALMDATAAELKEEKVMAEGLIADM